MKEGTKRKYLTIPVSFEKKLDRLAKEDLRTPSQFIINLVNEYEKNKARA